MIECELVIFDCDGVIIDSEIISAQMLIDELATHGVKLDLDYVSKHFLGRSYPVVLSQIRKDFGIELSDNFEVEYRARLMTAFQRDLKIMPGVRDVLEQLDVPYCLATSSSPARVRNSLEIVDLVGHFDGRITTSAEVAHGKPAPDLFLLAAEKHGTKAENCLVIEDSFAGGIEAGLAAGMRVWHFIGGGSHLVGQTMNALDKAKAHKRFANFDELFRLAPELKRGT